MPRERFRYLGDGLLIDGTPRPSRTQDELIADHQERASIRETLGRAPEMFASDAGRVATSAEVEAVAPADDLAELSTVDQAAAEELEYQSTAS